MSAGTRNSTHTLVGGPRRDRYSDVSPRPPVLGLHGTNGSSSVQYPGRFPVPRGAAASPPFSTPPPSDLPERTGPCQLGALRPRPCLAGSPSSGLFEGQASRSWSDANSTGRRPPGQSSGWDCELPATHSWRASNRRPGRVRLCLTSSVSNRLAGTTPHPRRRLASDPTRPTRIPPGEVHMPGSPLLATEILTIPASCCVLRPPE